MRRASRYLALFVLLLSFGILQGVPATATPDSSPRLAAHPLRGGVASEPDTATYVKDVERAIDYTVTVDSVGKYLAFVAYQDALDYQQTLYEQSLAQQQADYQAALARQQAERPAPPPPPPPISTPAPVARSAPSGACGGATNGADQYIQRESGGNPNAYNPSGATGCYQIMPGTWAASCSDLGSLSGASPSAQAACASRLPLSAWAG